MPLRGKIKDKALEIELPNEQEIITRKTDAKKSQKIHKLETQARRQSEKKHRIKRTTTNINSPKTEAL